ncbi:stromal cell-derived factor 2-like [Chiloscyllium plagiosum]|uniref:stromal cell-derived factor 2-like n=1 Tax=Chiloscyllium plagiosum TaxID=36176 RepID=UPI001CB7D315|nr:stromal cell-derived factor 2-like [Chiloscyllium plagiosum]
MKGKMTLGGKVVPLFWRLCVFSCFWVCGLLGTSDLSYVTCGSVIKLLNTRHNVRLHSHDVKYGSGSGQQSVTGVTEADDSNSYWRIRGKSDTVCQRGNPIKCGETIRLTHINTGRNLHSHYFTSPLSGNQEVSAFGENGEGDSLDNWTVMCSGTYWERKNPVRFKHTATEVLLSITGEQYGRPINGQLEVHGMQYSNQFNSWKVMEGIFMKPVEVSRAGVESHIEL